MCIFNYTFAYEQPVWRSEKFLFSYCFIGVNFCLVVIGNLIVDEASLRKKVLLTSPLPHAICQTHWSVFTVSPALCLLI